jgi:hypothetical protein
VLIHMMLTTQTLLIQMTASLMLETRAERRMT